MLPLTQHTYHYPHPLVCPETTIQTGNQRHLAPGDRVVVRRSHGELEEGWTVQGFTRLAAAAYAVVQKVEGPRTLEKHVPLTELIATNRTHRQGEEFAQATTFPALFALLEAKGTLWGSQKRYTAAELKVLINRVRSTHAALHLPLQVLPETGGLRQRVQVLLEAEAQPRPPRFL
jgi:hypothetical protein